MRTKKTTPIPTTIKLSPWARSLIAHLEGDVPVFLAWPVFPLGQRSLQGLDENGPRVPWLDDVVHVATFSRNERVGKPLLILLDQLFPPGSTSSLVFNGVQLTPVEDVGRPLWTHHRNLRSGPSEVEILSLIHISEPTRLRRISYAVFC